MEYVIGPILSLLLAMKFTDFKNKKSIEELKAAQEDLVTKIEKVEESLGEMDNELFQKSLKIIMPLAQATERLQQAVGVK
jgi:hypothetical protein